VKVVTDNEGNYAVQLLKIGNYSAPRRSRVSKKLWSMRAS